LGASRKKNMLKKHGAFLAASDAAWDVREG
jgi:hypothetical protein